VHEWSSDPRPPRLLRWARSVAGVWLLLGLRAGAGAGAHLRSRECLLEGEPSAGVHHWRAPRVDGEMISSVLIPSR
jgi:hypothetical protein